MDHPSDPLPFVLFQSEPLGYALTVDCAGESDGRFTKVGIEPTGHFWEHAVRQVASERAIDLASVTFDCESDSFVAYAASEHLLQRTLSLLQMVRSDDHLLAACLDTYEEDDDWTLREFIEDRAWNKEDLEAMQDLGVFLEFDSHAEMLGALNTIHSVFQPCYYDSTQTGVLAAIRMSEFVTYDALNPVVEQFSALASDLGGKLDCIDLWDELDVDTDHWVRFYGT
jgi:hypothetical protein